MAALPSVPRTALTVAACVAVVAAMLAEGSSKGAMLFALGAGSFAGMLWLKIPQRRLLIGLLFFVAPFDISKALIPPLERFYSPGLYVSIGEIVMLMLAVVWSFERVFVERRGMPFTRLDAVALGFLGLVWIGALRAEGGLLAYASALAYSLYVVSFYVVSHAVRSKSEIRLALKMLIIGFACQALHVAIQLYTRDFLPLPGSKMAGSGAGFDAQARLMDSLLNPVFRPIGAFDHPNALADYLTLLLPPAFAFVLMTRRRLPMRAWIVAVLVLCVAGLMLLLTLSRGGWAACLVGFTLVGLVFWRVRIIGSGHLLAVSALTLTGLVTVVAAFPQIVMRLTEPDLRSTESRILLSDQAFTIIKAHPFMGVGFGGYNRAALEFTPPSFAFISEDYQKQLLELVVHDHYLLVAAELGIPAMLYWIYLMICFVRQAWPLSRWTDPGLFALAVGLAGSLASQMLYLSSDNYYVDIRVFLLWLTAGMLQALTRLKDLNTGAGGGGASLAAPAVEAPS